MTLTRIGCLLVIASGICFAAAVVAAAGGAALSIGVEGPGGFATTTGAALLAGGSAILATIGARPVNGRGVRIGLGLVALGLLMTLATTGVSASSMLVIVYLLGGVVAGVGLVTVVVSLLAERGARRIGHDR